MSDINRPVGGVESVSGLKHHKFSVCGGPISVYEAGSEDSPKVLMLHGAMYDEARFIWDQLFPYLAKDYHVFAVDTPRHGRSRPWEGNLGHERLMDIFHAAFTHLKLDRFSMVGLSMGGGLCIEYASIYKQNVTSMVLFEPGGLADKLDKQFLTWLYIKTPGALKYLSKKYAKAGDEHLRKLLESLYVGGTKPKDPERLTRLLREEVEGKRSHGENDMDDWQINMIGAFGLKWNLTGNISQIKCPALWLRGEESVLVKQHEMERAVRIMKEGGAEASLEVIKNAGHLLPLEQPDKANAAVRLFLDKTARA